MAQASLRKNPPSLPGGRADPGLWTERVGDSRRRNVLRLCAGPGYVSGPSGPRSVVAQLSSTHGYTRCSRYVRSRKLFSLINRRKDYKKCHKVFFSLCMRGFLPSPARRWGRVASAQAHATDPPQNIQPSQSQVGETRVSCS